ncbi:MAG: glycosyltransferase family A protein [Nanoarchaeota archaeon]
MIDRYSLGDISVVIPTYNRAKDLSVTLKNLLPFVKSLSEIIVVDQSNNDETKKVVDYLWKKYKNILYVYSKIPSITIARNLGVRKLSRKCKLVCFIDDDVSVSEEYFDEILKVFNENPSARAASGYVPSPELLRMSLLEKMLRRLFYISYPEKDHARMISTYGNTYPSHLTKTICVEWLPGVNMVYKRGVFKEQQFDEHLLGYTVAEDIDFSYRLYKKYPLSLFITPFATLMHRVSRVERTPTPRMSYINQVDHFYFYLKNMRSSFQQRIIFVWSLLGITLLRALKTIITRKHDDFLKLRYFFISLRYCLKNRDIIQTGRVREF